MAQLLRKAALSGLSGLVLIVAPIADAQEFSADGVAHAASGAVIHSKVYMAHGEVRLEPLDAASSQEKPYQEKPYMVLDLPRRAAYVVNPAQKSILQLSGPAAQHDLAPFTVGASPCPTASSPMSMRCEDAGAETVNGRPAEKWQVTGTVQGRAVQSTIWVDPALHIVVKTEVSSDGRPLGGNELTNIVPGEQPALLFQLPAGYARVGPQ